MLHNNEEIKNILKSFYNRNAEDRNNGEMQEWKNQPRNNFLRYILDENKRSLLEIGAGTGKDSKFFVENGLKVVAIDLSIEMVKLCKEKEIEAYELDYFNLSSLNRSFDCVWSMNSLLHVNKSDLPIVLTEINNVLNPSGLFFMGVYGGLDWEGILVSEAYGLPRYFSLLADDTLKSIVTDYFDIISFNKIITGDKWDFQSVIMRKKTAGI